MPDKPSHIYAPSLDDPPPINKVDQLISVGNVTMVERRCLAHVFDASMGERGRIGFDPIWNQLIFYLKIAPEDVSRNPGLTGIDEMWVVLAGREN